MDIFSISRSKMRLSAHADFAKLSTSFPLSSIVERKERRRGKVESESGPYIAQSLIWALAFAAAAESAVLNGALIITAESSSDTQQWESANAKFIQNSFPLRAFWSLSFLCLSWVTRSNLFYSSGMVNQQSLYTRRYTGWNKTFNFS